MTWVYIAMRSINSRHVVKLRQIMRDSKCSHTAVILSRAATLRMYGPTLSARGGFWFHPQSVSEAQNEAEDEDGDEAEQVQDGDDGAKEEEEDGDEA
jgi:hypothetical protein